MMMIIDGSMINKFVEDTEAFYKCTDEKFKELDVDSDGLISRNDLPKGGLGQWVLAIDDEAYSDEDIKEAYDLIFDGSTSIGLETFRLMAKEIMLALVRGIGDMPIGMLLNEDSLIFKACLHNTP
uniref:EF-hand domain-containing protein n=1 Tax=Chenopodium quinoa TaxID=63459 RepID=A0A803KPM1_CHEQI